MNLLTREYLKNNQLPQGVECGPLEVYPEKILQFGEGNFLRAFVDWMINRLNREGHFKGSVVAVQPISQGLAPMINAQDGCYTVLLRGLEKGEVKEVKEVVTAISRCLNSYSEWEAVKACAASPEMEFVISNTTEAGIVFDETDSMENQPPETYPGKLTALLYHRWQAFSGAADKGLVMIPCELIEANGKNLRECVLKFAAHWNLPEEFQIWLKEHNVFCSTLVDRVVTGYPKDEIEEIWNTLGYQDHLVDTAELFHLWVIEGPAEIAKRLPFDKVGLDVVWTDDQTPYRTRKVRILNGAHTSCIPISYLYGLDTVLEMMEDPKMGKYVEQIVYDEIIPSIEYPEEMMKNFAKDVLDRFRNPYIKHYLLSILLNSTSKFKARVLPSLLQYEEKCGKLPEKICLSLASLLWVYREGTVEGNILHGKRAKGDFDMQDDAFAIEILHGAWSRHGNDMTAFAKEALGAEKIWGQDLNLVNGLTDRIASELEALSAGKMGERITEVIGG